MPEEITWGSGTSLISFRGSRVFPGNPDQGLPRISSGAEIERAALVGVSKIKYGDFTGGLARVTDVQSYLQALNQYAYNEGWQTRHPSPVLPYVLTTVVALSAVDISAVVAANVRAHAYNSSLGAAGLTWYVVVDKQLYRYTSITDSVLSVPAA